MFVNGGPRKRNNTAQMLESALKGAQEAGADCEMVNLYDLEKKKPCMVIYFATHLKQTFFVWNAVCPI